MSPEVSNLLKRALSLPVDERAALANTLFDSIDHGNNQADDSVEEPGTKKSPPHERPGS